jgi:hypothetical protein
MPQLVVDGLSEFRRNAKAIGDGMPKALGQANKRIGQRVGSLAERKRSALRSRYRSYSDSVTKIKPKGLQTGVSIQVSPAAAETGARRHPVFGVWRDQSKFKKQVWPNEKKGAFKGRNADGWLLYPTIEENFDEIGEAYIEEIAALARARGLEA